MLFRKARRPSHSIRMTGPVSSTGTGAPNSSKSGFPVSPSRMVNAVELFPEPAGPAQSSVHTCVFGLCAGANFDLEQKRLEPKRLS